jgi:hypothetical protein
MPAIRLSCPKCAQRLSAETDALRSPMLCPRCGAEFMPLDVIPPQMTLPAMPVVKATTDKATTNAGPVSAPQAAGPSRPDLPADSEEGATNPIALNLLSPPVSEAPPLTPSVFEPPAETRPATPVRPDATPIQPDASAPRPADPPPSILETARKAAGIKPAAVEIASLASRLQSAASQRSPFTVGYEHAAGGFALAAGLLLLLLALADSSAIRAVAGVLAVIFLAVALVAVAAFALLRWGPAPRAAHHGGPSSESPWSPPASASAQTSAPSSAKPGSGTPALSTRARIMLITSAASMCVIAAATTGIVAAVTSAPDEAPIKVSTRPRSALTVAAPPEVPPEQRADYKLKREGHAPVSGGVLYVPPSFRSDDGAFDLIVHFHGNTQLVEESIGAAKINALAYVLNVGTGSGPYEERYALPAVFDDALTRVRDAAEKRGLKDAKLRRIALSSWSAGYGATAKILESDRLAERIDAILLLDGLHVAYQDPKTKTKLDMVRLARFTRFAKEAAAGKKLLSITHGDTETHGYASAGEAADAILREIGAERSPQAGSPPVVTLAAAVGVVPKNAEKWLEQTSEGRLGGVRVRGYAGKTPEHHMAHLIQMSVTVLPDLAEHWKQ